MKKQKLLYILNVANKVNNFSYTSMLAAQELGYDFHIAGNWSYASEEERLADEQQYGIKIHQIDFIRAPYHPGNRKAYFQLKELIQREKYDVIHCNTPIGGVLGRILGKKCKVEKVIYQAHGFHFYKGAPKINWMIYYPIEKLLARYTDALITINQEDFELSKNEFKLRNNGKIYYVPGVGIDTTQYKIEEKSRLAKRNELSLNDNDVALISMGDLIERKNYDIAIRAVAEANNPAIHYFVCGKGPEEKNLLAIAKNLGVSEKLHFLGFRSDIKELLAASDIFLFTTKQEGLPRSMMEAMASGLPCVASRIRGNTDLLQNVEGGYLCDINDISTYAEKLNMLACDGELRQKMGRNNLHTIERFRTGTVTDAIRNIYKAEIGENVHPL